MDYEEKYKKTLEKARKELQACGSVDCDAARQIFRFFPELAESKDEMIKKLLVEAVTQVLQDQYCSNRGVSKENVIAWLEKQGEHARFIEAIQVGDQVTKNEDGVLVNLSQLKRVAKPAEEYNITGISSKNAQGKLGEMIKNLKPTDKVEPKFKVGDKIYLKPEYRMADDDTPIANTVKEIIRIDDKHYRFDGSYIFIEDQDKYELVEQKTAWSEEDDIRLNAIVSFLERYKGIDYENTGVCISWLKSLKGRYTWKPSEEQMKALHDLNLTGGISYAGQEQTLINLYNDLKKLKG